MPKVLPEYLELRKQQILDSAAACFTRDGFHQTTMQDICAEADLSPGAVYRYFRSKEEIIQAMCSRGHEEDTEVIQAVLEMGDTLQVMDELIRIFFEGVNDREICALSIELLAESRRDSFVLEAVREGGESIRRPLVELVRRAQERGEVPPAVDPEAMARVMFGVYQGLVCQKMLEPDLDVAPYAAAVRALFHGEFWQGPRAVTSPDGKATVLQH